MSVDTVEVATIHVLQVKGKTGFAASFAGNPASFSENRSDLHQKLRPKFRLFLSESRSSKKVPHSLAGAWLTSVKLSFLSCPPESLGVPERRCGHAGKQHMARRLGVTLSAQLNGDLRSTRAL